MDANCKAVSKIDQQRIQTAVREILSAIGEDVEREGLIKHRSA